MRELKAFVRTRRVDAVIQALRRAGAPGVSVSRVHGVGYGYEPVDFTLAPSELRKAPEVAKVEVVCADCDCDRLVGILAGAARTGDPGDGIVFVDARRARLQDPDGRRGRRRDRDGAHVNPRHRRCCLAPSVRGRYAFGE